MPNPLVFLKRLLRHLRRKAPRDWRDSCRAQWAEDPLSHPALRSMTLEQLADLPFERGPRADAAPVHERASTSPRAPRR